MDLKKGQLWNILKSEFVNSNRAIPEDSDSACSIVWYLVEMLLAYELEYRVITDSGNHWPTQAGSYPTRCFLRRF